MREDERTPCLGGMLDTPLSGSRSFTTDHVEEQQVE
jgi:hypothetical protein